MAIFPERSDETRGSRRWFAACALLLLLAGCSPKEAEPVKIGVIFSLTGAMADSARPLVDAVQLAVEELNRQGGILERKVEAVAADDRSDPAIAAREAERLLDQEKVSVLIGCWTSSCRKAVKPVVEQRRGLLFYPLQYEGLERSSHIIYTGSVPNQQIIPALRWAMDNLGKRLYLVGSDYIFPRTANRLIKELAASQGAEIVGERYLPMGETDMSEVVREIAALRPNVALNTINGDSNRHFFAALRQAGLTAETTPILSFSIAEVELAPEPGLMDGHYAAWSYFQSIDSPRNREFVARFKQRFGQERVVDDPMEAAYLGVLLWAQGARSAHSTDPEKVNHALARQSLEAPQGIVSLDSETRHLWRMTRLGRARPDGQFSIVWSSNHPVRPNPFPSWHHGPDEPRGDALGWPAP